MSIFAQVTTPAPEDTSKAEAASFSGPDEQWEKIVAFWNGIEWESIGADLWNFVQTGGFWIDMGAVAFCIGVAVLVSRVVRRNEPLQDWYPIELIHKKLGDVGKFPIFLVIFALLLWLSVSIAGFFPEVRCPVLRVVTIIYTAYLAFLLPNLLAPGKLWVKLLATVIIGATVLHMLGLLGTAVRFLKDWGFQVGEVRLTAYTLILGPVVFLLAYGVGKLINGSIVRHLTRSRTVPPTVRVLTGKLLQFGMLLVAIGITLSAMGINLTAITVFGGALGLGVGFGLQKVVSNLISGVIILLDRSIKPGDVIEIGDTWGVINGLQTRYVSVMTRDKKEILIPNEDFITQPVVNWSFSDRLVRYRVPFGVSYDCDVREAIRLAEEAAAGQQRVRKDPGPSCRMRGFGDSAIDLELRFWIVDPSEGRGNIISEVLLSILDAYQEAGIEIPYPHRDVRIRNGGFVEEKVSPDHPDPD